jgi:CDP-diacylglycerol---serine O-phosphatidyltransferase
VPIRVTRSVIPSLFTTMNLFSGFFAIVQASLGEYPTAAWLIVLGGIFDALDGAMARLTKSSSEFGVELDSLADVVTFGTAPSFLLWAAFFRDWGAIGVVIAALPAIAGSLRLARFNVQLVGFDKDYFVGCPIPTAAIVIISYLVFYHLLPDSFVPAEMKPAILTTITIGVSALMVSTIRYDTLPGFSLGAIKAQPVKSAAVIVGLVICIVTKGAAIFPILALYLLFGIVRHIVSKLRDGHEDVPADDDAFDV